MLSKVLPLTTLLLASPTLAQERPADGGGSADNVSSTPSSGETFLEGAGVKVTEGMYLHPRAQLSTGYQSNVFYMDPGEGTVIGSGIMRLGVGGSLATRAAAPGSAEASGSQGSNAKLNLKADLDLTWNQYLSSDVNGQSGMGVGLLVDAKVNPQGPFVFTVRDGFTRLVRPPQGRADEVLGRDRNELSIGGRFKPGGGAIEAYANYTFGLDMFEQSRISFANRMAHIFALGGQWQWLPMTRVTAEASFGYTSPDTVIAGVKDSSMPLRVTAGISTLITPTFGTILKLGYGNGFYASGPNFNSYLAQAEGRVAIGPSVRAAFGYAHDFTDSVVSNYYSDHALYGRLALAFAQRFEALIRADLRFRAYDYQPGAGLVDEAGNRYDFCSGGSLGCSSSNRSDVVYSVDAGVGYQITRQFTAGLAYTFRGVATDFYVQGPGTRDYGSYVWHEVVAKVAATF